MGETWFIIITPIQYPVLVTDTINPELGNDLLLLELEKSVAT